MIAQKLAGQALPLPGGKHRLHRPRWGGPTALPRRVNDRWSNEADDPVRRAFARVRSWRTPPHWSDSDWHAELRAILHYGAARAGLDYDKTRGVPLRAHTYMGAVAAAWTRYRQEWSYYLHSAVESDAGLEPVAMLSERSQDDDTVHYLVGQALRQLSLEDQWLVQRLFWNGTRQGRVAVTLHVSQQEVSRRKARVLRQLRRLLNGHTSLLLSRLVTVCWALFDSLDLLPVVDLL